MAKTQSNISQLRDFLSYVATVKGDLSNITAPPFILSPKSVTEIPASWAERHDLFLQPASEDDPARRALLVLENFICSLKRQAYIGASEGSDNSAKKPLNAFLGEVFLGTFNGKDGSVTQLISEQVSHHPPVTASCLYNRTHGVSSSAYVAQETSFSSTSGVKVQQIGHIIIRDEIHRESHLMTLPTTVINGLLSGSPYPELEDTCYIASSSGFLSTIEFHGKKAFGIGTKNGIHASMVNIRDDDKLYFEITGQWNGRLEIADCLGGKRGEQFDIDTNSITEVEVQPIERQNPWESRKAWTRVRDGIVAGDMHQTMEEKEHLEDAQRDLRSAEEKAGLEWPRVFFRRSDDSQEFHLLAKIIPDRAARHLNSKRTAGVWKFIGIEAAEALLSGHSYHGELEPTSPVSLR